MFFVNITLSNYVLDINMIIYPSDAIYGGVNMRIYILNPRSFSIYPDPRFKLCYHMLPRSCNVWKRLNLIFFQFNFLFNFFSFYILYHYYHLPRSCNVWKRRQGAQGVVGLHRDQLSGQGSPPGFLDLVVLSSFYYL